MERFFLFNYYCINSKIVFAVIIQALLISFFSMFIGLHKVFLPIYVFLLAC